MNTEVVEDPHWIFPGEQLNLVPGEAVAVAPEADRTAAPAADTAVQVAQAPVEAAPAPTDTVAPPPDSTPSGPLVERPNRPAVNLPPPRPTGDTGPTVFARKKTTTSPLDLTSSLQYRPVIAGQFYS